MEFKEDERKIDESKEPYWMDANIKTKEVDISNNGRWSLAEMLHLRRMWLIRDQDVQIGIVMICRREWSPPLLQLRGRSWMLMLLSLRIPLISLLQILFLETLQWWDRREDQHGLVRPYRMLRDMLLPIPSGRRKGRRDMDAMLPRWATYLIQN